ncbi:4-alpha-glucanotransferase [Roseivivax halodurans]|nr:4-alpha-glucanotransferase [Roseivivax halodurans]
MTSPLDRISRHHGLTLAYDDPEGGPMRPVPDETKRLILEGLHVDPEAEPEGHPAPERMTVPEEARCHLPGELSDAPAWGIFCQLYELRSARNWGIGDFADLAELARICATAGADFLGINPVHALFLADPDRRSPFFPSNRRFLNPLYIAPDRVPGAQNTEEARALRSGDLVDYPAVAEVKLRALRAAFDAQPPAGAHAKDFETFCAEGGTPLRLHALFEAISSRMAAEGHGAGWRDWPEEMRDPNSPQVAEMAERLAQDVAFHLWLQWIARLQLREAQEAALDAGMRIGLYLDVAVGEAPDGSSTWSGAAAELPGLAIGAPPDMFATEGQVWGLSAPSPVALESQDFAPFAEMIAAQLHDAGALRIDHAMALWQLFLVPEGESPARGTHLRFPFPDMLRTLSRLSREHEALVIGEDLGFVPAGFRDAMAEANILSYRILYFEQTERGFVSAAEYPVKALACLSTHDLPVLAGWWRGEDVELRREYGMVGPERSAADAAHRAEERADLVSKLRRDAGLEGAADIHSGTLPDAVLDAAHRFIARTPCLLTGVRLADLVGPEAPTNLPGTTDEYPNWRPRCPVDLDALPAHPVFARVTALMREERPRPAPKERT